MLWMSNDPHQVPERGNACYTMIQSKIQEFFPHHLTSTAILQRCSMSEAAVLDLLFGLHETNPS